MKLRRKHSAATYARRILGAVAHHPANKGNVMRALGRAIGWQVFKRTIGTPVVVEIGPAKAGFLMFPDSSSCGNVAYFGWRFDYWESEFLSRYLRPGDGVMDGGANVGFFSVLAASMIGSTGTLVAFEPLPANAERIRANLSLNGFRQGTVIGAGLGRMAGAVRFIADMDVSNRIACPGDAAERTIEIEVVTLDRSLDEREWAFWKLDVEGAELDALLGAEHLLASRPPAVIQLELIEHLLRRQKGNIGALVGLLESAGYRGYRYVPESNRLAPVKMDLVKGNVLAIHCGALTMVERRLRAAPGVSGHASMQEAAPRSA